MSTDIIPIETLGAEIKARIEAGDKALDKADQHYIAAGIQLLEAKTRVADTPGLTWPAFLNAHCGIRRRRADDLIALADGRTTLAEMRSKNRERVSAHRERKKSESALRNAEPGSSQISEPVLLDSSDDEVASLKSTIAKLRERLEIKESQLRMAESEAVIARKQREEAQNRAMFAEADKERLTAELAEAKAETARLMADIDAMTKPTEAVAPATLTDFKRLFARMESADKLIFLEWARQNVKPESDDTLTEDQIPAFLKKEAA